MRPNPITVALTLSLAGNVYLGFALLSPPCEMLPSGSGQLATSPVLTTASPTPGRNDQSPTPAGQADLEFRWEHVESPDLATYARNLRSAGFPEEVIRDALGPVIEERYGTVLLEHARFAFPPKWAEPPKDTRRLSEAAITAAQLTRREQLKQILGLEEHELKGYKAWDFQVWQENLPFLDQDSRKRFEQMREERSKYRQDLKARGLSGKDLDTAMRALISEQATELQRFLPDEAVQKLLVP